MNRILIDTNVILDLLARREPYYLDSKKLFSLADKSELQLIISALSIANAYYILNDILKIKEARAIIGKFKVLVELCPLDDKIVELALNDNYFRDFEDGIQYYTALESDCELILTRNIKDFKRSDIPVLQPVEYMAKRRADYGNHFRFL